MDNLEYDPNRIYQQTILSQPGDSQPGDTQPESYPGASQLAIIDRLLSTVGEVLVRTGSRLIEHAHAAQLADEISPPNFIIML